MCVTEWMLQSSRDFRSRLNPHWRESEADQCWQSCAGAAAVCFTGEAAEFTCKVKGQARSRVGNQSGTGNSQSSLLHTAEHIGERAALTAEDGAMLGVLVLDEGDRLVQVPRPRITALGAHHFMGLLEGNHILSSLWYVQLTFGPDCPCAHTI